jgi:hypothetical protein
MALIVNRVIAPASKLATVRALNPQTAASSLGERLALGEVAEAEIYGCLDWLLDQQERIETGLAKRHLTGGTLTLYDVSSSYLEGSCCELARHGYSRDHRSDRPQIVYGLLCDREGCPVAIEVFEGNTADPMTLATQVCRAHTPSSRIRTEMLRAITRSGSAIGPRGSPFAVARGGRGSRRSVDTV